MSIIRSFGQFAKLDLYLEREKEKERRLGLIAD